MSKITNFNNSAKMNVKANALKEISEQMVVLAEMIAVKTTLANKSNRSFDPSGDKVVANLVSTINELAEQADITVKVNLSEYIPTIVTDDNYNASRWDDSGCSELSEWYASGAC